MEREALIIQFQTDGRVEDFDWLIGIEEALIRGFSQNNAALVDGHDFGNGTMNIVIFKRAAWSSVIEIAMAYLKHHCALDRATIAKRLRSGRHVVVWPHNSDREFDY